MLNFLPSAGAFHNHAALRASAAAAFPLPSAVQVPYPFQFDGTTPDIDIYPGVGAVIAGTTYTEAQGIAAGIFDSVKNQWDVIGAGASPTQILMRMEATTTAAATPASLEAYASFHDGTNNNRLSFIRQTTARASMQSRRAGLTATPLDAGTTTIGANTPFSMAGRWVANAQAVAHDNSSLSTSAATNATASGLRYVRLGAFWDGSNPGGTVQRLSIWYADTLRNTQISALSGFPYKPNLGVYGAENSYCGFGSTNYSLLGLYQTGTIFMTVRHDGVTPPHAVDYVRDNAHGATQSDTHNQPQMIQLASGKYLTAEVGHSVNSSIAIWRGTTLNASDQTYILTLNTTTGTAGAVTAEYARMFQRPSDGRVFLFTKGDDYGWGFFYSDDEGSTWSNFQWLLREPGRTIKVYIQNLHWVTTTKLRIFYYINRGAANAPLKIFEWDTSTGDVTSGDGSNATTTLWNTGTATTGTGVDPAGFKTLMGGSLIAWISAMKLGGANNATPLMLANTIDDNYSPSKMDAWVFKFTGTNQWDVTHWTFNKIVNLGQGFGTSVNNGGATFDDSGRTNPRVYAFPYDGTTFVGETWDCDSTDGLGNWTKTGELFRGTSIQSKGNSIRSASARLPVLWYGFTSYTDYNSFSGASLHWPGF